jgi:IS5 family transposase
MLRRWPRPLELEGIEAIVFRTVGEQVSRWEATLPAELLVFPDELSRVDRLLDDPVFFAPFARFFDPRIGRPSTPIETYLRLIFLKVRYRLGYESLGREVADSITWRRFCRNPLEGSEPHPTTLIRLTTRCGGAAADGLNEALLGRAAEARLPRTTRLRVDTTVVPTNVSYPTGSGLLAKAVCRIAVTGRRPQAAGGAVRTKVRDRSLATGSRVHFWGRSTAAGKDAVQAAVHRVTGELARLAERSAADAQRQAVAQGVAAAHVHAAGALAGREQARHRYAGVVDDAGVGVDAHPDAGQAKLGEPDLGGIEGTGRICVRSLRYWESWPAAVSVL